MQPRLSRCQCGPAGFTRVAGPIVDGQEYLFARGGMARVQRCQVAPETGGILPGTHDLDAPPAEHFDAPKDRQPPVRPSGGDRWLLAPAVPDPGQVRVGLQMRIVLVMELVPLGV